MTERRIRCALLTSGSRGPQRFPESVFLATPGLQLVALRPSPVGAPEEANLLGLPEDDRADVVLVTAWWHRWLTLRQPERADDVMSELERRADVIVGVDGPARFALSFPPAALERLAVVIKFQGIYRDRDLYNYMVGPEYSGANWTEKLRPQPVRYRDADLEKLRLSVPFFMETLPTIRRRSRRARFVEGPAMRWHVTRAKQLGRDLGEVMLARAMGLASGHWRPLEVHCLTGLTHVQRIEAMQRLEGFTGTLGIVLPPEDKAIGYHLGGTRFGKNELSPEGRDELAAPARRFSHEPMGRVRFMLDMRRHRVAVAPTGDGELTYRHGEALYSAAALVCQDLSHVEMMLPLEDRVNVAFCRPDLSDLRPTVEELLRDEGLRKRIAKAGRRSFMAWAAGWRAHLYNGIEAHIREALGTARAGQSSGPPRRDRACASR